MAKVRISQAWTDWLYAKGIDASQIPMYDNVYEVELTWQDVGIVSLGDDLCLVFPRFPVFKDDAILRLASSDLTLPSWFELLWEQQVRHLLKRHGRERRPIEGWATTTAGQYVCIMSSALAQESAAMQNGHETDVYYPPTLMEFDAILSGKHPTIRLMPSAD